MRIVIKQIAKNLYCTHDFVDNKFYANNKEAAIGKLAKTIMFPTGLTDEELGTLLISNNGTFGIQIIETANEKPVEWDE